MTIEYEKLKMLAEIFAPNATLYAVGGYVRDRLLGIESGDIDVCSSLEVDTVKVLLAGSDFVVLDRNLRMGTVVIVNGKFSVEYTTFRVDSYLQSSGMHSPLEVSFTSDMLLDSKRRDFRINAIYLDILLGEIVDLLGGIADIKNRVLSTVDLPEIVFEADGLRILRLVRFASELGFDIEELTWQAALANAWRVKDIVAERILDELDKIFVADTAHIGFCHDFAHATGLLLLDKLGLVDMLLPELANLKGLQQPTKYHLYDAYCHSVEAFKHAPPHLRYAALLHDIGKTPSMAQFGNMHHHGEIGVELLKTRLQALKMPKARARRICELASFHMVDLNGDTAEKKLRWFVAEHAEIILDLCSLQDADAIASNGILRENRMRKLYFEMVKDGAPLAVKELKVGGNDLIKLGFEPSERGKVLADLWKDTIFDPALNTRERAIEYLETKNKRKNLQKTKLTDIE